MQRHFNLQGSDWDLQLTKDNKMVLSPIIACNRNYNEKTDLIVDSRMLFFVKDEKLDYSKIELKLSGTYIDNNDEEIYQPLELLRGFETGKFRVVKDSYSSWGIAHDFSNENPKEQDPVDLDKKNYAFVTFSLPANVCVFEDDEKYIVKKVYDGKFLHLAILLNTCERFHYCFNVQMIKDVPGVPKKEILGEVYNLVFEPNGRLSKRYFLFRAYME